MYDDKLESSLFFVDIRLLSPSQIPSASGSEFRLRVGFIKLLIIFSVLTSYIVRKVLSRWYCAAQGKIEYWFQPILHLEEAKWGQYYYVVNDDCIKSQNYFLYLKKPILDKQVLTVTNS